MEQSHDLSGMLDLIIRPAFAVTDGIITHCNQAARSCMLTAGTPAAKLLETGRDEYAAFSSGCLYLTLQIAGHSFGASVSRMDGFDVFVLDEEDSQPQLQAMALAARELRDPLADMMIAADRLMPADDSQSDMMQLLNRSLYHMLRLVGNMSDAARYAQHAPPRQELRDITAVVGDIFEKAAVLAEHTGITLRFSNHPEGVLSLTDTEKLERGIYNMLSNAIKFSERGSVIDAKLTRRGNKLHLTVCDSGSGIPDDGLGSVFFRHLRQPGVEESRHGIGLGMVMIRSAAFAHGGTVLIEKNTPEGTRLTMTLSIRKDLQGNLGSPRLKVDYAGEFDHGLIELADVLPPEAFKKE